jgi:hypothetical protein
MRKEGELLQAGSHFALGCSASVAMGMEVSLQRKRRTEKLPPAIGTCKFGGDFSPLEVGVFRRAGAGSLGTAQEIQIKT